MAKMKGISIRRSEKQICTMKLKIVDRNEVLICFNLQFFSEMHKDNIFINNINDFLFLTFSNIPMDESTFGVHQIELVIKTSPCFSNGCGVR